MPVHYDREVRINKIPHMSPSDNNAYILTDPITSEGIIIDTPGDAHKLLEEIGETKIKTILITHGHGDHIAGYRVIKDATDKKSGMHEKDSYDLQPDRPDFYLKDGDEIQVGATSLRVIHTPGHTPGSVCLLTGSHLFSGDTLFPGGPGATRTSEKFRQILDSIVYKLLVLPDDTNVYPGHGDDTTIGDARKEYSIFASNPQSSDLFGTVTWLDC